MTILNILIYLALIVFILARKVRGQPIGSARKLFALPVIVTVIGYGDLTHGSMKPLDITLTVIGAALSLGLGMLRGRADKLSTRDGSPFMRWGAASLILFFASVAAKLVLDLVGLAAGDTASAVGESLVFTFGLTLVGEVVVLWLRSRPGTFLPRTGDTPVVRAQDLVPASASPRETGLRLADAARFPEDHHHHHHHHHHEHHVRGGG